jgi:DNA topoisomerase-3
MQAYAQTLGYKGALPNTRPNKRYVDDSKVAEHEAITPTEKIATAARLEKMSPLEKAVYLEVMRTTLAMFAPRYEYDETTIITAMPDVDFKSTGKVPISKGWHELWPTWKDESTQVLPIVQGGDAVKAQLMPIEKQTQPPKRYSEGTLLIAMKTAGKTTVDEESQTILKDVEGIGTEATRANVIEKLKSKDKTGNAFISVKNNAIYMAPKGNTICQAIATTPLLSSAEMTAQWEKFLKRIGQGQKQQAEFVTGITKFLEGLVHDVPEQLAHVQFDGAVAPEKPHEPVAIGTCPKCGGKVMMLSTVSKCENNKRGNAGTCDFKLSNVVAGKKLSASVLKELLRTGATAKKVTGFKSKKGKSFSAKLVLKQNEIQFDFD